MFYKMHVVKIKAVRNFKDLTVTEPKYYSLFVFKLAG